MIASNTGPSQLIDGYGRVIAGTADVFSAGIAMGRLPTGAGGTLYTTAGDVGLLVLLIPALLHPL